MECSTWYAQSAVWQKVAALPDKKDALSSLDKIKKLHVEEDSDGKNA